MRINTNFHSDWHGRQVESPQHQPRVAKSRQPNKLGKKPQTETIYNNPTKVGQSLKQRLYNNPTKLGQSLKQRLYNNPTKLGQSLKQRLLYITTQQRWDKVLNRDYITTQQSWDKNSNSTVFLIV